MVPELGGDEEIFTLHDRGNKLLESLSDLESRQQYEIRVEHQDICTAAHLGLVLVHHGLIDVTVSIANGDLDLQQAR